MMTRLRKAAKQADKAAQQAELITGQAPVTRSDSYRSIYSNNVTVLITKWDVRLTFSELEPVVGKTSHAEVVEKASVVMSHAHFASMLDVIQNLWKNNKDKLLQPPAPKA